MTNSLQRALRGLHLGKLHRRLEERQSNSLDELRWNLGLRPVRNHDSKLGFEVEGAVTRRTSIEMDLNLCSPLLGEFPVQEVIEPRDHGVAVTVQSRVNCPKGVKGFRGRARKSKRVGHVGGTYLPGAFGPTMLETTPRSDAERSYSQTPCTCIALTPWLNRQSTAAPVRGRAEVDERRRSHITTSAVLFFPDADDS